MKKTIISLLIVLLFVGGVMFYMYKAPKNSAPASDPYAVVGSKQSGTVKYLTDFNGRTLYTFAQDKELESTCNAECLQKWPVFEYSNQDLSKSTSLLTKQLNIVKRADGYYQYAYGTQPLYYYIGDTNPGDKNGDGLGGIWNIVLVP